MGFPLSRGLSNVRGREVSGGSVYAALGRLELNGLVASRPGESASERAGRAKRYFCVTELGPGSVRGDPPGSGRVVEWIAVF